MNWRWILEKINKQVHGNKERKKIQPIHLLANGDGQLIIYLINIMAFI